MLTAELPQHSSDQIYNNAVDLQTAGHCLEAVELYRKAMSVDSQSADIRNNLGLCLASLGEYEEAVEMIRSAIELRPEDPDLWSSLGEVLLTNGRVEAAYQAVVHAVHIDPDHAEAVQLCSQIEPLIAASAPNLDQGVDIIANTQDPPFSSEPELIGPPEKFLTKLANLSRTSPVFSFVLILAFVSLAGFFVWRGMNSQDVLHGRGASGSLTFVIAQSLPYTKANVTSMVSDKLALPLTKTEISELYTKKKYLINSISKQLDMVGIHAVGGNLHGFLYSDKKITDLAPLPGDTDCSALFINTFGTVVGYSGMPDHRATMWLHDKVYDLNRQLKTNGKVDLTDAIYVDDSDSIVAIAKEPSGAVNVVRLIPGS